MSVTAGYMRSAPRGENTPDVALGRSVMRKVEDVHMESVHGMGGLDKEGFGTVLHRQLERNVCTAIDCLNDASPRIRCWLAESLRSWTRSANDEARLAWWWWSNNTTLSVDLGGVGAC